ncbi:anti-sigma-I factor RsgI6-like isoform X1 [Physella acuta]|uniref:anti-sigma-I factor RsgI6-like isoform X1 n=1 Tax=Physella acuta TaxID=109671 RepID=UPI0027DC210F|nr:anti-sigma-I factor RsgI6-like isoform X1 [Physella acuta]
MSPLGLVALLLGLRSVFGGPELLLNPGFENGINGWHSSGFLMTTDTTHVHGGVAAVRCSGRTNVNQGPSQNFQAHPDTRYTFHVFLRLATGSPTQEAKVTVALKRSDNGQDEYIRVANHPYITPADGWVNVGGNFHIPNHAYSQARVYLEGIATSVEFYIDDASLKELEYNSGWKAAANAKIEEFRKSNIHFNFHVDPKFSASDIKVKIDHRKHLFGFGSLLRPDHLLSSTHQRYRDIAYYMFNWAVLQDYKWTFNRGTPDHPDYSRALAATDELAKNGIQVRGHCMFWDVPDKEPSWVKPLSGQALKDAVDERIRYMTSITKGKLAHWDINNEILHGNFFEAKTGDPAYSQHMYRAVHAADPSPKLFLNDYNVVAQGSHTLAYLTMIQKFKSANIGLGGVGVQSHFSNYTAPDVTLMKHRLDVLGIAGLPIWITELDLSAHDENTRADWYENALRVYFSHPSVEGVLFWGFWDDDVVYDRALVHGSSFTLDKAGERYLHLIKEEWSTHVNRSLSAGTSFNVKGFQGTYDLTVLYHDKPIQTQTFTLGKTDKTLNITISGDGHQINVPAHPNPFG